MMQIIEEPKKKVIDLATQFLSDFTMKPAEKVVET